VVYLVVCQGSFYQWASPEKPVFSRVCQLVH
jgi:hypothetical protein